LKKLVNKIENVCSLTKYLLKSDVNVIEKWVAKIKKQKGEFFYFLFLNKKKISYRNINALASSNKNKLVDHLSLSSNSISLFLPSKVRLG
jgi:hypothetical protein